MYSTKTIEKILLANTFNKKSIQATALSSEARSKYEIPESTSDIMEFLSRPEYSQAIRAYMNGHRIYRGMERYMYAAVVTPGIRVSKNTSNIYTRLLSDIFTSWQDFPKRNRSTICSTSYETAAMYSYDYPFVIFPQNNTKIAICSRDDIWYSFPFLTKITNITQLSDFNVIAISILEEISKMSTRDIVNLFDNGSVSDIKQLFKNVEEICLEKMKNPTANKVFILNLANNQLLGSWYWIYHKKMSLLDYIEYIMSPQQNKFKLISIDEIPKKADKELWFEGQHLMIRADKLKEFRKTLEKMYR